MQQLERNTRRGGVVASAFPVRALPWTVDPAEIEGGKPTALGSVADHLYGVGISEAAIGRVVRTIGAIRIRAHGYTRRGKISEQETVAQLVLPLLQALGWTPQRMALQWSYIDVALFRGLSCSDETLDTVVEVKRLGADCSRALHQAERYAEARLNCRRLVLTDGIRYAIYLRRDRFRLHAYLDLQHLCDAYPSLSCLGAKDALLSLLP